MTVYLLCFTNDVGEHVLFSNHAGHYLGETDKPVDERRDEHQAGRGANLTAHAAAAGITFVVARTWPGGRTEERRLKGRPKGSHELKRLCPECHPMPRIDRWAGGTPAWARQAGPGRGPQHQQRPAAAVQPPAPDPARVPRPRIDRYQQGVAAARRFLDGQAGRTADQIARVHEYITGPWHAHPRHAPAAAEEMRGYLDTVTAHLSQLRAARQHPAPRTPVHAAVAGTAQSRTRPLPEPAGPTWQAGSMVSSRDQAQEENAAARTAGQLRELADQLGRGEQAAQHLQAHHTAAATADDSRARGRSYTATRQRQPSHNMEIA